MEQYQARTQRVHELGRRRGPLTRERLVDAAGVIAGLALALFLPLVPSLAQAPD